MTGNHDQLKKVAAEKAVEFVQPGMVVGLGHGSTAMLAIRRIAELLEEGRLYNITGVACSLEVDYESRRLGIPMSNLEEFPVVDVTIDGADEVDPELNCIKGGGGALLREKLVAQVSREKIIVVDESKLSTVLGARRPVPVEVIPFAWKPQEDYLASIGARVEIRREGMDAVFTTDQGNMILDCHFGPIDDPPQLAAKLTQRSGIVEHGLFLGLATLVIVSGKEGIRLLEAGR